MDFQNCTHETLFGLKDAGNRVADICRGLPSLRAVHLKLYVGNHDIELDVFEEWLRVTVSSSNPDNVPTHTMAVLNIAMPLDAGASTSAPSVATESGEPAQEFNFFGPSTVSIDKLEQLKIISCDDPGKCRDLSSRKHVLVDWKSG
jgi:hypothetical protein